MTTEEGQQPLGAGALAPTGPSQAPPRPSVRRSWWQRTKTNPNFRRTLACIIGFLVLAVMLGPEGSATSPLSGVTSSLFSPSVLIFLGLGLAMAGIMIGQARYGARIRRVSKSITSVPSRLLPDRRTRAIVYSGPSF